MNEKIIKNEEKKDDFTKLSDLTAKEVSKFIRVPVRMNRRVTNHGLNTNMQLVLNPTNLVIPMVSTELIGGVSRKMRYFKPDRFINLLFVLNLPQIDERGMDINHWVFHPAIRFVKGLRKNGDEYYSIEIVFKQYHYETIFLTNEQVSILNALEKRNELKDYKGIPYKIKWVERPDVIEDLGEDLFEFN